MVTAIRVPKASTAGASAFEKLGARRYLVISIAMAAARVAVGDDGSSVEGGHRSRLLLGGGAAAAGAGGGARRVEARQGDRRALSRLLALDELAPIDDVRGSADYRREAAREIVLRALNRALGETGAEIAA